MTNCRYVIRLDDWKPEPLTPDYDNEDLDPLYFRCPMLTSPRPVYGFS